MRPIWGSFTETEAVRKLCYPRITESPGHPPKESNVDFVFVRVCVFMTNKILTKGQNFTHFSASPSSEK